MPVLQGDGCDQGFYWQPEHDSVIELEKQKGELQLQFPPLDLDGARPTPWAINALIVSLIQLS